MSEPFSPRLCGGTFFTLLTRAMKTHGRGRGSSRGAGGLTEAGLFKALIRVYDPSLPDLAESTESSNATNYKKCENPGRNTIPLTDQALIRHYAEQVTSSYGIVLKRMSALVDEYIDVEGHGGWLVQALLELIREDQTIPDERDFHIHPDGSAVKKKDLDSMTTFYLQPFLVGVWTAIILHVPDNTVGKQTYASWHQNRKNSKKGSRPDFVSSIGQSPIHPVSVSQVSVSHEQAPEAVIVEDGHKLSEMYQDYLVSARNKYSMVKTIMDEAPKPFYDFYVCNGLQFKRATPFAMASLSYEDMRKVLRGSLFTFPDAGSALTFPDPTVDALEEISHFVIIEGTGGLGKSMMLRHLMLNTIDRVDFIGKIPIFVNLRDYDPSNPELTDFIFDHFRILCPNITKDQFHAGLARGDYALLLDGLDEIGKDYHPLFDRMLNRFADAYPGNVIVMSSRPDSHFTRFERFFEMELLPLSKEKALQLIDKLDYPPGEPELKKRFMDSLDNGLYESHHDFAENPLLLTFMLMRFEYFGDAPTQMHVFYDEVYEILSKRHDTTKVGFTRAYLSGLRPDKLKDFFAAFCAKTYTKNKIKLSRREMEDYIKVILSDMCGEAERSISPADVIQDLISGVCMMYEEGQEYLFTHLNFQEYFCALSFSRQKNEDLGAIGEFFEQHDSFHASEKVLKMFYDMIPDRVEKFIFIPLLSNLFPFQDDQANYWNYVKVNYPQFCYDIGETDESEVSVGESFLVDFLLDNSGFDISLKQEEMPFYENLVEKSYARLTIGETSMIVEKSEIDSELLEDLQIDGDPETVGWTLEVCTEEILKHKEQYKDLIEAMERKDFRFVREFETLKRLQAKLNKKHSQPKRELINVI